MHIVFIVGSYYPNYSAVGKCVGNVADELAKEHNVTVICQKGSLDQKDVIIFNNQKIIGINTRSSIIRYNLNKKITSNIGVKKDFYKSLLFIYKTLAIIKIVFSNVSIQSSLVKSYLKALNDINDPIDIIIPSSMPFESTIAASKYVVNDKIKIIPYLFDQFVDSATLHRFHFNRLIKRKRHLNLEKWVLSKSYRVLAMHSLNRHFLNDFPEIKKIHYVEHPLLIKKKEFESKQTDNVQIAYVGGLYRNYVIPNYLLELYKKSNIDNVVLHFYIVGNCFDIVNKYAKLISERIINHGSVDTETASLAISKSNILISIAENKGVQMSSKIFEYISNGKPIIHLYSVDNDVNLNVLNKYPLALCLKQDYGKINENIILLEDFIETHSFSTVSYEDVLNIFSEATPQYTANLIVDFLKTKQ